MLDASGAVLTLSTTMPLVPPASDTDAEAVVVGIKRVMSKFSTQPPLKRQRPALLSPLVMPTNSLSVVPFLSSVNGEASPVLFEISIAPGEYKNRVVRRVQEWRIKKSSARGTRA